MMKKRKKTALYLCLLALVLLPFFSLAEEIVLTFGGDCVLGTRQRWKKKSNTFDALVQEKGMDWCFAQIRQPFETDDFSTVNLEVVLQKSSKGHERAKRYTFRGEPSYTQMLTGASIEHVNVANNHYIDFGRTGRASTIQALEEAGVYYSGYTYRYIYEKNGHKIGFAGCRETVWRQKPSEMLEDLQYLKEAGCDVIVYACHWGKEYSPTHNKRQEEMADAAIAAGADLLIGTHPHVVQGIEQRGKGVVVYSLGNLVFGGTHEMKTFDGLVVQAALRFTGDRYEGVELRLLPVLTSSAIPNNNFQPAFATGWDETRILQAVQKDSDMPIEKIMWFPAAQP